MPGIQYNALLEADADRVWSVLKRFGDIASWHPAIAESQLEGALPDGMPGCVRVLRLADGGILRERLLAVDELNRSFTYCFDEAPLPVDDYHLTVTVLAATDTPHSFLCWAVRFDVQPGYDPAGQVAAIQELVCGGHRALANFLAVQTIA
jgi:hypothetical protein